MKTRTAKFSLALMLLSSLTWAREPPKPADSARTNSGVRAAGLPHHQPVTNEAAKAEIKAKILAYTGGTVQQVKESRRVVFLNLQDKVGKEVLVEPSETIGRFFRIESVLKSRKDGSPPMKAIADELKDAKCGIVVLFCSDSEYPTLLLAPESRWALVNVAQLATDKPAVDVLAARVQREQWRAFAYLTGAGNTGGEKCPMKTILSPDELDGLNKAPAADALQRIFVGLGKLGINPARQTSYRKACEEGWAPAPTNAIQKAIWEEIKAKPKS